MDGWNAISYSSSYFIVECHIFLHKSLAWGSGVYLAVVEFKASEQRLSITQLVQAALEKKNIAQ